LRVIRFNFNNLLLSAFAFFALVGGYILLNVGSKGPDINNYVLMTRDYGGVIHQIFIIALLSIKQFINVEFITTVLASALIFCIKTKNFSQLVLACIALILIFHLSYAANTLLGNIIRQGIATIVFIYLWIMSSKLSLISVILHQAMVAVYLLKVFLNSKFKSQLFTTQNFLIVVLSTTLFSTIFGDRFSVLIERNAMADLSGALFTFCLLITRFIIFKQIQIKNYTNIFILILLFFVVLLTGEFGQRVIISLIFILDISYAISNYRKTLFYFQYLPILCVESVIRYTVVGNFWGIL
tara:strand:+ start:832 stop:1722 length:891 start_codon:yes stop_codon:yes gene_type:complete